MPARGMKSRGSDPVAAFIELAANPRAFAERKAELDSRVERAEAAEAAAGEKLRELAERERLAAERDAALDARAVESDARTEALDARERTVADGEASVAERTSAIEAREQAVAEREVAVGRMAGDALDAVRSLLGVK